jgi:hypothetical protein
VPAMALALSISWPGRGIQLSIGNDSGHWFE